MLRRGAVLFLAGYSTFFPNNIIDIPRLGMPLALMSMYMLLTHMGTLMSVQKLMAQWKTVVIALSGLVGMSLLMLTAGSTLFGWQIAVAATPPLAGGIVAALLMSAAAKAEGLMAMYILTEEAAKALAKTPEEKEFLMNEMLPKTLVGGLTTVTITSVILAGIMAKWL